MAHGCGKGKIATTNYNRTCGDLTIRPEKPNGTWVRQGKIATTKSK